MINGTTSYIDGQLNGQVDEADQQYDYPAHTGDESYGTAYNAGYDYALQWLIDQNSDYLPHHLRCCNLAAA